MPQIETKKIIQTGIVRFRGCEPSSSAPFPASRQTACQGLVLTAFLNSLKVQSRDIEQIAVEQKPWETVTETDFEWSIVPG
jgi:hypothetical protein